MNNLGEMRKAAGLTQSELAHRIGTSYTRVSDWERGVAIPTPQYLRRMAEVLGVPIEKVFDALGINGE